MKLFIVILLGAFLINFVPSKSQDVLSPKDTLFFSVKDEIAEEFFEGMFLYTKIFIEDSSFHSLLYKYGGEVIINSQEVFLRHSAPHEKYFIFWIQREPRIGFLRLGLNPSLTLEFCLFARENGRVSFFLTYPKGTPENIVLQKFLDCFSFMVSSRITYFPKEREDLSKFFSSFNIVDMFFGSYAHVLRTFY